MPIASSGRAPEASITDRDWLELEAALGQAIPKENLGHEKVLTTLTNYGNVTQHRLDEIFEAMANEVAPGNHRPTLIAVDRERLERLEGLIADLAAKG